MKTVVISLVGVAFVAYLFYTGIKTVFAPLMAALGGA